MTELFSAVSKASFQGSIVILAVIALRFLLKKAPKSLFCLLWLLAGLRLVMLFEIQSPLSLQPRLEDVNISIQAQQPVQTPNISVQNPEGQPLETPAEPVVPPEMPEGNWDHFQTDSYIYGEKDGVITGPVDPVSIAAWVWLLGAAVMLSASAFSYWKLKRRVREGYLIENGCFECPGLDTAFVLGFFPPRIYLPMGLSGEEKKFVFDHENTHIARNDHWFKILGYGILSIHWFNPLVWLGYSLLCRDMELACDEHVVKYMTLPQRKAYSAALLSCGGRTARFAACPVAFGESNPKKRILNVLNYKRPSFWISLLAIVAVIFVAVCLLTSPENKTEVPEDASWNLEMKVTDVSAKGLTVKFVQNGIFRGSDRGQLMYGTDYSLERLEAGGWVEVETLSQENPVGWATVGYTIEINSIANHHIDWDWLYGELPAGQYRIGKSVTLDYPIGDDENQTFYTEFTIEESGSEKLRHIWDENMMEEEYLTICRDALAELQSREQFHISETLVYFTGETEDSRSNVVFWRDGDNWLRESYVTRMRENRNHLHYDNVLYQQRQKEGEDAVWTILDNSVENVSVNPWIHWLRLEERDVIFDAAGPVEDEFRVSVRVCDTPPALGWDDIQEFDLLFIFDEAGNLTRVIMGAVRGNLKVMDDMKIETTLADNIHTKMERFAAQRPCAEQKCDDPTCTDSTHDHSGIVCTDESCTNSTHHHNNDHHDDKHHH